MRNLAAGSCVYILLSAFSVAAPLPADPVSLNRIADAAFNHGEVVDIAAYLADQIGGRMTNSPAMRKAERWTQEKFKRLGIEGRQVRGLRFWPRVVDRIRSRAHDGAAGRSKLRGIPIAWTPATNGVLTAPVIVAPMAERQGFRGMEGQVGGQNRAGHLARAAARTTPTRHSSG